MNRLLVVVAALLLVKPIEISVAAAAENPEHFTQHANANLKQKKADKILAILRTLGISDPEVTSLVNEINTRSKDGYFMLREERIETGITSGTLTVRYATKAKIGTKQLELLYAPDNSNTEYSVRTNAVMVNYKLNF